MSQIRRRAGLSADLFGTDGKPVFREDELARFVEAGIDWSILPAGGRDIHPSGLTDFDALFIGAPRIDEASLAAHDAGRLRVVARNGVGYDAIEVPALERRGILLTNTPLAVRHSVAASALALVLALGFRLTMRMRLVREGRWAERGNVRGVGVPGRTLGIVGLGGIGRELVRLAKPLGMRIVGADPFVSEAELAGEGVVLMPLDDVVAQSDFLVIACLLNADTRHLLNAERLARMKPTAFLVNVARGPIVDEAALIAALERGAIAGAGLDVFEREPVDPDNPLLAMESVIATPHSLCWTDTFMDGVAHDAISSIIDALDGRLPRHVVNPAAAGHPRVQDWLAPAT